MAAILISIKKDYSDLIFNGEKSVEYRKVMPSKPVDRCFVYESRGSGKVIGFFTLSRIESCKPSDAWDLTEHIGALGKRQFDNYYKGKDTSVLLFISDALRYDVPLALEDLGISRPPQSFSYLDEHDADALASRPGVRIGD